MVLDGIADHLRVAALVLEGHVGNPSLLVLVLLELEATGLREDLLADLGGRS